MAGTVAAGEGSSSVKELEQERAFSFQRTEGPVWPELREQAAAWCRMRPEMRVEPGCAGCELQTGFGFYPKSRGESKTDFKRESNLITFAFQKEQAG